MTTTSSLCDDLLVFSDNHRCLYGEELRVEFRRLHPEASSAMIDLVFRRAAERATEETTKAKRQVDAMRENNPPAAVVGERLATWGIAMRREDRLAGRVPIPDPAPLPWEDALHRGDWRGAYEIARDHLGEFDSTTRYLLQLATSC